VTLITGGGFHGKSTVLQALQWGHHDHIPGDGRERVVTLADTVKIRAEDGRRIEKVDVSAFLSDLPGGRSTCPMSTDDASGSTSQAAALVEAVESGARLLLLDEDTCATNLMVRDDRMRELVGEEREPITPLVERIRELYEELGVSTVLVVGGVGDYLSVADRVLLMDSWQPRDVSDRARGLAGPAPRPGSPMQPLLRRVPQPRSLTLTGKGRVRARDGRRIEYGLVEIDLGAVEQLATGDAARSAGLALALLADGIADGQKSVPELLDALEALLRAEGVDVLSPYSAPPGDLVSVRRHEVAACLNRLRTLKVGPGDRE
jgi:predicted ABC-class ATPase